MSQPRWVTWWEIELRKGIQRIPGPASHPRILEYWKHTSWDPATDEPSWCSAAMCCCMEESKITSTRSAAAISWETWKNGRDLKTFRPGAIVVISRHDPANPNARHVTMSYGEDSPGFFWGLGGNQKNSSISVSKFSKDLVTALKWPLGESL